MSVPLVPQPSIECQVSQTRWRELLRELLEERDRSSRLSGVSSRRDAKPQADPAGAVSHLLAVEAGAFQALF